jgi:hypothetical protein
LAYAQTKPMVVLLPGFFNSLAADSYFSNAIVKTIEKRGHVVAIVNNLLPTGTLAQNGQLTAQFLNQLHAKYPTQVLIVIAHSAGGFYLLSALDRLAKAGVQLPIQTVVTLSTPYMGVDLVENLSRTMPAFNTLTKFFSLSSLSEFRTAATQQFLSQHAWPKNIRWVALGGEQNSCRLIFCNDASRLSWVMSLAQSFIGRPSDGIVSFSSSVASGLNLPIERWSDFLVPLDHWEATLDYRLFSMLGVTNVKWIRDQQALLYGEILNRLEK